MKDIITTCRVVAKANIFDDDYMEAHVPSGMTLREILGNESDNYAITINGLPVNTEVWNTQAVQADDLVTIVRIPSGEDDNSFKRFIGMIIVLVVAYYAGPAAAGAVGWGSAAGWSSAIAFVGAVVVNLVFPPLLPEDNSAAPKRANSLTGTRNKFAPFEPLPNVYGRHRLYPPIAAHPYTEVIGTDQYLTMIYCVGLGEYDIVEDDIKIGNTPIKEYSDVQLSFSDTYIFPDTFELQQSLNFQQSATPGDVFTRTTQANTDEISTDFLFPAGLIKTFRSTGDPAWVEVHFSIEYRISGSSDPWIFVATNPWHSLTRGARQIIGANNSPFNNDDYPPPASSSYGALSNSTIDTNWLVAKGQTRDPLRMGLKWSTPTSDTWDVRITRQRTNRVGQGPRIDSDETWNTFSAVMVWTALRSIDTSTNGVLLPANTATFAALRLRATDQLNGIVDSFNLIVTRRLRSWNKVGQTFNAIANTRDPAWAYLDILTGLGNARPITNETQYIDLDALADWATENASENRYYDDVIDFPTSVFEALSLTCSVGRGSLSMNDGKWSVILEQASPTPVQYFTPRNSFNFSSVKQFVDFPHAIRTRFNSEDTGYQEDEMIVYDDGYNVGNATKFEALQLRGITDSDQAWTTARYTMAAIRLRPEVYTFNTDMEHIVAQRGDHVLMSHDIPLWGNSYGRIKAVNGNIVTTDEAVTLDGGTNYVMRVRLDDGTSVIEDLTLQGGPDIFSHTFTPSIPAGINVGDLYMIGEVGSETAELVIIGIEPGSDLSAKVTCVDHNAAILTADNGPIPPWNPNVTLPNDPTQVRPTPPFGVTANSDPTVYQLGGNGVLIPRINISWNVPADGSQLWPTMSSEIRWREYDVSIGTDVSAWNRLIVADAYRGGGVIDTSIDVGAEYEIQVRNISPYDIPSLWSTAILHTVGGETRLPPGVDGVSTSDEFGGVIVDIDVTSVEIRVGAYFEILYATVNDRDDVGAVTNVFPVPADITSLSTLQYLIPFSDTTPRYFWARLVDIYGLQSIWEPLSSTAGVLGTPLQSLTEMYYIKATTGTAIHNGTGTLTLEARHVTGASDVLLSSGTIQLFDPIDDIVNVANGYQTGSDGYTGILDASNINDDIIITLKDGVGGTVLDTITLVDIADGLEGDHAVYGYIEPVPTLAWSRDLDSAWTPSDTFSNVDVTFVQTGADVARVSRRINRSADGVLSDGGAATHAGGDLNTSRITPSVGAGGSAITVTFDYVFGGDTVSISETLVTNQSSSRLVRYYIKPIAGTAIKNSGGQLTIEAHEIDEGVDTLLNSGTIFLYDEGNNIVNVANGYVTGSDGWTGILDAGDINGDIVITMKDGVGGVPMDTITLVDVTDGVDAPNGYIEPENGLAWRREGLDGPWTPSQLTTDLDVTFTQAGADVARQGYRLTLNATTGQITGATTTHPGGDLNTSRITITPTGSGTSTMTVQFDYLFSGDSSSVSETVFAVMGGPTGLPGPFTTAEYDDLDTTQLAAGESRYAMLTARATNTSGSQNNFHNTDGILINKVDKNGVNRGLMYSDIRVGSRITYYISNTRWFLFLVDQVYDIVGSGSAEAYKFGVTLADSVDPDPTANISTSPGTDVEFYLHESEFDIHQQAIIDPDFDYSSSLGSSSNRELWNQFTDDSVTGGPLPDGTSTITLSLGTGPNNSNVVRFFKDNLTTGSPPRTSEGRLWHGHRIRTNIATFDIKVRWRNNGANDFTGLVWRMLGFSSPIGGSIEAQANSTFQTFATTGATWQEDTFHVETAGDVNAQYWEFRVDWFDQSPTTEEEVEIDSIFVFVTPQSFGATVGDGKVQAGIVPESDTTTNAGQYLKADGTWDDPVGGSASNSFETQTVTDTDSGYSWAATGSAVAESATDTLTLVSGVGIDIDVDAASDAIRVTNTAVAAGFSGLGVWRHRTETGTPPGSGQIRYNNGTPASATSVYIHETNDNSTDMANFLALLQDGAILYIQDRTNADNYIVIEISSNTDSGTYRTFGIQAIEVVGTEPSQNTQVSLVGVEAGTGEVNDLTAAVTWDDIPIANVPTGTSGSTVALGNHTHQTFDRSSSVLSGANVFSNIVVTDGIVSAIATRALTAANIGAAEDIDDLGDVNTTGKQSGSMLIWNGTDTWVDTGADVLWIDGGGTLQVDGSVTVTDRLIVYNAAGGNGMQLDNVGGNFLMNAINVSGNIEITNNSIVEALSSDFYADGFRSYSGSDYIDVRHSGSNIADIQFDSTTTRLNIGTSSSAFIETRFLGVIKLQERVNDIADSTGYGQIWVNSNDAHLYFTTEGGTQYQISGVSGVTPPIDLLDNEEIRFGTGQDVLVDWDGVDFEIRFAAASRTMNLRDGVDLRIYDTTDTDWISISTTTVEATIDVIAGNDLALAVAGNERVTIKSAGAVWLGYGTDEQVFRTQDNNATDNITGAEIKHWDGSYYDVGMARMPKVNMTGALTVSDTHWHKRIVHNGTIDASFNLTFNTESTQPQDVVLWVMAKNGPIVLVDGSMVLHFYDGSGAPATGNITVARGGWATVVKDTDSAAHVTGVGLS